MRVECFVPLFNKKNTAQVPGGKGCTPSRFPGVPIVGPFPVLVPAPRCLFTGTSKEGSHLKKEPESGGPNADGIRGTRLRLALLVDIVRRLWYISIGLVRIDLAKSIDRT